jgi:hypothetical protein
VKRRFIGSLAVGVAAAAALTGFAAKYRHAALVAAAARSQRHGDHQTVASILAAGFAGTTLAVAVVVFVVASVLAWRRRWGASVWR